MNNVVVNSPATVVHPIKDDECEAKPEPPKPEPECCEKTYHIVLHFH